MQTGTPLMDLKELGGGNGSDGAEVFLPCPNAPRPPRRERQDYVNVGARNETAAITGGCKYLIYWVFFGSPPRESNSAPTDYESMAHIAHKARTNIDQRLRNSRQVRQCRQMHPVCQKIPHRFRPLILWNHPVFLAMNDNGILEHVGGQYIAEAIQTLPPAITAEARDHFVEINAGHAGRVRLTFRKQKAKRAKHSHWFWSAKRAEKL